MSVIRLAYSYLTLGFAHEEYMPERLLVACGGALSTANIASEQHGNKSFPPAQSLRLQNGVS